MLLVVVVLVLLLLLLLLILPPPPLLLLLLLLLPPPPPPPPPPPLTGTSSVLKALSRLATNMKIPKSRETFPSLLMISLRDKGRSVLEILWKMSCERRREEEEEMGMVNYW